MTYTEKELDQFLHGISLSLLSKKSAQHWRYDEETAKEIEWLEVLERKVRADKADRKTENNSEKPNNSTISKMEQVDKDINVRSKDCETCKWGEWYRKGYDITMMSDECGGCCSWNSKWTPKDEPQTCENRECKNYDAINDHCMFIEQYHYEPKTEPQTCDTCRFDDRYGDESICKECARHYSDNYAPIENEPQTERHLPDYSYEADLGRRIMEQTDCSWK